MADRRHFGLITAGHKRIRVIWWQVKSGKNLVRIRRDTYPDMEKTLGEVKAQMSHNDELFVSVNIPVLV